MAGSGEITHVSDTGLWVAIYRAMESERPDALFHDPYARRLAGPRGEAIVKAMPQGLTQAWAMIVRTQVFDEIIHRLIGSGIDEVLNLACGLDARPYRLDLPATLRWTDVDFPGVIEYKSGALADEKPRCEYRAIGADLSDASARARVLDDVAARSARVLVITEGLLIYLATDQVALLARDLAARPCFKFWLTDLANPLLLQYMNRTWGKRLSDSPARFQFAPADGPKFFEPAGWKQSIYLGNWDEAKRLDRRMKGAWLWDLFMALAPPKRREQYRMFAGTLLLERTSP